MPKSSASDRPTDTTPPATTPRFVPSGVDAQSWMGFEQRIQERRFQALVEAMKTAIATGDAVGAHVALEEARELRPTAPGLETLAARIDAMRPMPPPPPPSTAPATRWRAASGVLLLLVGVSLLTGLEYMRQAADPDSDTASDVVSMRPPTLTNARPAASPAESAVATAPAMNMVDSDESRLPRGTSGFDVPAARDAGSNAGGNRVTPRALQPPAFERRPLPDGEVPDDFVYPSGRELPRGLSLQVLPIRSSASLPPAPARPDDSRVRETLNAYARAYGQLDAAAARQVWPSVDERALARAFAALSSQNLSFDDCHVDVQSATASASCRGRTSFTGAGGDARTEPRHWRFELRREGEEWKIETAEARRP